MLVYVNDTCVLGFSHQDVVNMFQSIPVGEQITLEVCRGYPLPFDINDPNLEIRTTVGVTVPDSKTPTTTTPSYSSAMLARGDMDGLNASQRSTKSMPDLTNVDRLQMTQRNKSVDELDNEVSSVMPNSSKPEFITVDIVKGTMGFGFTIADSAYGQKVSKQSLPSFLCATSVSGWV